MCRTCSSTATRSSALAIRIARAAAHTCPDFAPITRKCPPRRTRWFSREVEPSQQFELVVGGQRSAVTSNRRACGQAAAPAASYQRRIDSTANAAVSWSVPRATSRIPSRPKTGLPLPLPAVAAIHPGAGKNVSAFADSDSLTSAAMPVPHKLRSAEESTFYFETSSFSPPLISYPRRPGSADAPGAAIPGRGARGADRRGPAAAVTGSRAWSPAGHRVSKALSQWCLNPGVSLTLAQINARLINSRNRVYNHA